MQNVPKLKIPTDVNPNPNRSWKKSTKPQIDPNTTKKIPSAHNPTRTGHEKSIEPQPDPNIANLFPSESNPNRKAKFHLMSTRNLTRIGQEKIFLTKHDPNPKI